MESNIIFAASNICSHTSAAVYIEDGELDSEWDGNGILPFTYGTDATIERVAKELGVDLYTEVLGRTR